MSWPGLYRSFSHSEHCRTVVRIAWETIGNHLHLLVRGVVERVSMRDRVDHPLEGNIIVKVDVDLTVDSSVFARAR